MKYTLKELAEMGLCELPVGETWRRLTHGFYKMGYDDASAYWRQEISNLSIDLTLDVGKLADLLKRGE